jgi:REP element-mobilizing transposase RayT
MTGIIDNQGHKLFAINGTGNHVHVLVSMNPTQSPSDLMYHLKRSSSLWINERKLIIGKFSWQEGYGAFSCGKSQVPELAGYIESQEKHHQKQTFMKEYLDILEKEEIAYDKKYVFKEID